jgi:Fic/DOC family
MGRKSRLEQVAEREHIREIVLGALRPQRVGEIQNLFATRTGRRIADSTLRLRISELTQSGDVVAIRRRGSVTTYWRPDSRESQGIPVGESVAPRAGDADEAVIPLTPAALTSLAQIQRARALRTPVGYDGARLDAYTPGTTWYLPAELRKQLMTLGETTFAGAPAGTYARDIMQRLIIDLSFGSSRLEGNKYSRIDTEELLLGQRMADAASDRDYQMILNHKAAIEFLVEDSELISFTPRTMLTLHALLAENLLSNEQDEGRLRTRAVTIGNSVYTPTEIPQVIEEHFTTLLRKVSAIPDPFEQAFFLMLQLPYLQPFIDVNKRTSRLAANIPLIQQNLCPLSFVDVPEDTYSSGMLAFYETGGVALLRDVFAWAYERSCQQFKVLRAAMGDPDPIRLRYRTQLRVLVGDIVRNKITPTETELSARALSAGVPVADLDMFVQSASRDLRGLRPELLARYRLLGSEFDAWKSLDGSMPS